MNFYKSIISESESTILSRLVIAIIATMVFFIPYFIGVTDAILNEEYRNNLLIVAFMGGIVILITVLAVLVSSGALYFIVRSIKWVFTGNSYMDSDDIAQFIAPVFGPFIFIFNFLFCKNDDKTLLIKRLFQTKNKKAKELLNE